MTAQNGSRPFGPLEASTIVLVTSFRRDGAAFPPPSASLSTATARTLWQRQGKRLARNPP